jgi:hypothetical protein
MAEKIGLTAFFNTKQFAQGLETYMRGLRQAEGGTEQAARGMSRAAGAAQGMGGSVGISTTALVALGVVSGGTAAAIGAISAAGSKAAEMFGQMGGMVREAASVVYEFGRECIQAAGEVDSLQRIALLMSQRQGLTTEQTYELLDAVRAVGIRADSAATLVGRMATYELNLSHATELATMAQNLAVIANENSSDTLERLVTIILTGNRLMARHLGLQIDFEAAQRRLADSLGIEQEQLNDVQFAQANLNALLEEGARFAGAYAVAQSSPTRALMSMEREIYNLRVQLGAPFLDAWYSVIMAMRHVVQALIEATREGDSLYSLLVNLGAVASIVADAFSRLVNIGLKVADDFINAWLGSLNDSAYETFKSGVEIVTALAEGMLTAASEALLVAIRYIGDLLMFWFAPGSAPRIVPEIDRWGAAAMTEFLRGFTRADFDVLQSLQSILRHVLGKEAFADISQYIAGEIAAGGIPTGEWFATLAANAGEFGEEIARLAELEFRLADATETAKRANEDYADSQTRVRELTAEYNNMLRSGADKNALETQLERIRAAEHERDAAAERARIAQQSVDALTEEASLQEALVRQLVELSERERAAGGERAQAGGRAPTGAGGARFPQIPGFGEMPDVGSLTTRIADAVAKAKERIWQMLADLFSPVEKSWDDFMKRMGTIWGEIGARVDGVVEVIDYRIRQVGDILNKAGLSFEAFHKLVVGVLVQIAAKMFVATGAVIPLRLAIDGLRFAATLLDGSIGNLGLVLSEFIARLSSWWMVKLVEFGDYIRDKLTPALNAMYISLVAIGSTLESIWNVVRRLINAFRELGDSLPDWARPGSPPPLYYALRDISSAMDEMSTVTLPKLNMQMSTTAVPVLAAPTPVAVSNSSQIWSPSASFGPNYFTTPIGEAQFNAMAERWFRNAMRRGG